MYKKKLLKELKKYIQKMSFEEKISNKKDEKIKKSMVHLWQYAKKNNMVTFQNKEKIINIIKGFYV